MLLCDLQALAPACAGAGASWQLPWVPETHVLSRGEHSFLHTQHIALGSAEVDLGLDALSKSRCYRCMQRCKPVAKCRPWRKGRTLLKRLPRPPPMYMQSQFSLKICFVANLRINSSAFKTLFMHLQGLMLSPGPASKQQLPDMSRQQQPQGAAQARAASG